MTNHAFVVRTDVLGVPLWVLRRLLDFVRWVLIVAAVFVALSCFVQGALLAGVLSSLAGIGLKFGSLPWRVYEKQRPLALSIFASAIVFVIAGIAGLILNRPLYLAREAQEVRTAALAAKASANKPAHASSAVPTQYHYITGLDTNGDNWLALRSEPSIKRGSRLMKMGPETLLTVLERKGGWVRVRTLAGDAGWASAKYIACCRNPASASSDRAKPQAANKQLNEPAEAQAQGVSMDLATSQVTSKRQLEAVLLDPDSARYQNVLAHKATDNGVTFFAFCGEAQGKNVFGGYTGYHRFVATPWVATTEPSTVGFEEIWQRLCLGPSSEVWF